MFEVPWGGGMAARAGDGERVVSLILPGFGDEHALDNNADDDAEGGLSWDGDGRCQPQMQMSSIGKGDIG